MGWAQAGRAVGRRPCLRAHVRLVRRQGRRGVGVAGAPLTKSEGKRPWLLNSRLRLSTKYWMTHQAHGKPLEGPRLVWRLPGLMAWSRRLPEWWWVLEVAAVRFLVWTQPSRSR